MVGAFRGIFAHIYHTKEQRFRTWKNFDQKVKSRPVWGAAAKDLFFSQDIGKLEFLRIWFWIGSFFKIGFLDMTYFRLF